CRRSIRSGRRGSAARGSAPAPGLRGRDRRGARRARRPVPRAAMPPAATGGGAPRCGSRAGELPQQRQDLPIDVLAAERTHMAEADAPGLVENIGLRHAVDAELDADPAVAVDAYATIRVAELRQEFLRVLGLVLIGDAVEGAAAILLEAHQERMLGAA